MPLAIVHNTTLHRPPNCHFFCASPMLRIIMLFIVLLAQSTLAAYSAARQGSPPAIRPARFAVLEAFDSENGCEITLKLFRDYNPYYFNLQTPGRVEERNFIRTAHADLCSMEERRTLTCSFRFKCEITMQPGQTYLGASRQFSVQHLENVQHTMVCPDRSFRTKYYPWPDPVDEVVPADPAVLSGGTTRIRRRIVGRCLTLVQYNETIKSSVGKVRDERVRNSLLEAAKRTSEALQKCVDLSASSSRSR